MAQAFHATEGFVKKAVDEHAAKKSHITDAERRKWDAKQEALSEEQLRRVNNALTDPGKFDKSGAADEERVRAQRAEAQISEDLNSLGEKVSANVSRLEHEIASLDRITKRVVAVLPETGEDSVMYLVPSGKPGERNAMDEYMWILGKWERVGSTEVDLSGYVKSVNGEPPDTSGAVTLTAASIKMTSSTSTTVEQAVTVANNMAGEAKSSAESAGKLAAQKLGKTETASDSQRLGGTTAEDYAKKTDVTDATKLTPVFIEWKFETDDPDDEWTATPIGDLEYKTIGWTFSNGKSVFEIANDTDLTVSHTYTDYIEGLEVTYHVTATRAIVGYRLGPSEDAPLLVPVTEKTEGGKKTYELPAPIKTQLFADTALTKKITDEAEAACKYKVVAADKDVADRTIKVYDLTQSGASLPSSIQLPDFPTDGVIDCEVWIVSGATAPTDVKFGKTIYPRGGEGLTYEANATTIVHLTAVAGQSYYTAVAASFKAQAQA